MHNFEKLKIWQKAIEIAVRVYEATATLPAEERYNLTNQIKRCAISIPSNIAEGAGRNHDKEFIQFLAIANGSTYELMTQLILAQKLDLFEQTTVQPLIDQLIEVSNMNYAFQKTLKEK